MIHNIQNTDSQAYTKLLELAGRAYDKGTNLADNFCLRSLEVVEKGASRTSELASKAFANASEFAEKVYENGEPLARDAYVKGSELAARVYVKGSELAKEGYASFLKGCDQVVDSWNKFQIIGLEVIIKNNDARIENLQADNVCRNSKIQKYKAAVETYNNKA